MISLTDFLELVRLGFVQRAALAGLLTAVACALLGVFLIPRRFAMISDGLAHFALAAVGLALLVRCAPIWILLPAMVLASLLILHIPLRASLYGDAVIGMVSVSGLALGVLLASVRGGFNVDLFSYLFGDILAVSPSELLAVIAMSLGVITVVSTRFHELVAVTADPVHTHVLGISVARLDRWLAVLTALTVGVGLRTAGALLISSFLIFPAVAALQIARSFRIATVLAAVLGALAVVTGLAIALIMNWPAAPAMTMANLAFFLVSVGIARFRHGH